MEIRGREWNDGKRVEREERKSFGGEEWRREIENILPPHPTGAGKETERREASFLGGGDGAGGKEEKRRDLSLGFFEKRKWKKRPLRLVV